MIMKYKCSVLDLNYTIQIIVCIDNNYNCID